MKPVTQNKLVTDSTTGNCLAACLASIFECEIHEIPEFEEMHESEWFECLVEWLWSKGRGFKEVYLTGEHPKGVYIGVGQSPRNPKNTHAVVVQDGEIVHDPHPSRAGVTKMSSYWTFPKNSPQDDKEK